MEENRVLIDSQSLRRQLGRPLDRLCFDSPFEEDVAAELWQVQRNSAMFTLLFMTGVWLVYMGVDIWRLNHLVTPMQEPQFMIGVVAGRFFVLAVFAGTLRALLDSSMRHTTRVMWMQAAVLSCSMAVIVSSYTLKKLGLPETSNAALLTIVVAMAPLGMRVRDAAPVAVLGWVLAIIMGLLLLSEPVHLREHWILMILMCATLVFCTVTAYYREKAQREQIVMRKLLDWEASHDPLTALPNRRLFREHFQRAVSHARRENVGVHLAIIDVDHFKLYNDHYGHQAGDVVLCELGQLLSSYARRPLDLAVRLGGEEFALLIFDDEAECVVQRMNQLRADVAQLGLLHVGSPIAKHVTVSIGVTEVLRDDTLDTVFSVADKLLYAAKSAGRDQVKSLASAKGASHAEGVTHTETVSMCASGLSSLGVST